MGKGNRERLKRGNDTLLAAEQQAKGVKAKQKKKGVPLWLGNTILISIAALLVIVIAVSAISSSGILFRLSTYAYTEDFHLSGSQMVYLFNTLYSDFVSDNSSYISYFLDSSQSLKKQESIYTDEDGNTMTWFEVFANQTKSQAEQIMVLCQMAKSEGLDTLTEEEEDAIQSQIDSLSAAATQYGYTLKSYVKAMYGAGVTPDDIVTVMRYQTIAANYYDTMYERLEDAISAEDVEKYFNEHKKDFQKVDYLKYIISVAKASVSADAEESKKQEAEDKYKEAKELADKYAAKFEAVTTVEEFKTVLLDYLFEDLFEDEFESEFTTAFKGFKPNEILTEEQKAEFKTETLNKLREELNKFDLLGENEEEKEETEEDKEDNKEEDKEEDKEEEEKTDEEKLAEKTEKAKTDVYNGLLETFQTKLASSYIEAGTYTEDDEYSEWLFNDERKDSDKKVEKKENDGKTTYTVTSTFVVKAAYKQTDTTKNVGHILFTKDKYETLDKAKEEADKILAEYLAGELTKEAFEKLGEEHTEDSNVFYENVTPGQMVTEFNDWIYDDDRKAGDTGVVKTTYGYHVMFFEGEGLELWYLEVLNTMVAENYSEWYKAAVESTGVVINEKNINDINI